MTLLANTVSNNPYLDLLKHCPTWVIDPADTGQEKGPDNCGCSPGVSYLTPANIHAAGILSAAGPRRARTSLAAGTWRFLP